MNKIPLSVSSTLDANPTTSLSVTPYDNMTGKTGTQAPVLIAVESAGTVDAATFAAAMPARGGQGTASQARLVVNALAAVLAELVDEYGAISVATPFGRVETFVAGSLEYATDPVDPDVNVPFLGIVPGADVMRTFAKIEAYVPTGACPASLKRVRDVETGDNAIHGVKPFYLQGYGMTYGGTGESAKLLNPLTRAVVSTMSVDAATKSESQLKCTLPSSTAVPAGTYVAQVTTLAGGSGKLWPLDLKVRVAEPVVPTPAPTIASVKDKTTGEAELIEGDPVVVDGTNLGGPSDTVTVSWKDQQGQPQSKTLTAAEKTSHTATQVEIAAGFWQSVTLGDDTSMTFKVTTAGGSAEKTVEASK